MHLSSERVTGILSLSQSMNAAVAKGSKQEPPPGIGIDSFEFWLPARRPNGKNLAMSISPPIDAFRPEFVINGVARPTTQPNAWVAAPDDAHPKLSLHWPQQQHIARIELSFDTDFDHPMESVLMGHPERDMPFCVCHYRICSGEGKLLADVRDNHQTRNRITLQEPVTTDSIHLEILETHGAPAAILEVRCYGA